MYFVAVENAVDNSDYFDEQKDMDCKCCWMVLEYEQVLQS